MKDPFCSFQSGRGEGYIKHLIGDPSIAEHKYSEYKPLFKLNNYRSITDKKEVIGGFKKKKNPIGGYNISECNHSE